MRYGFPKSLGSVEGLHDGELEHGVDHAHLLHDEGLLAVQMAPNFQGTDTKHNYDDINQNLTINMSNCSLIAILRYILITLLVLAVEATS